MTLPQLRAGAILLPLLLSATPTQAAVRGRGSNDETPGPWVFRTILENKTRMLVLALRTDLWAAYNPANGTLHKVWSGALVEKSPGVFKWRGILFRGKVWDFGQQNSLTHGTVYHQIEDGFVFNYANESTIPAGWTSTSVTTGSQWTFSNMSSSLVSSSYDLTKYSNVILSYMSPGANGKVLRVQVSTDNGANWNAQWWDSIDGPPADGNQKLIAVTGTNVRFRIAPTAMPATGLQDLNLAGDYHAWTASQGATAVPLTIDWRGYQLINQTDGVIIKYDAVLEGGARVSIHEQPEVLAGIGMSRKFTVTGLPSGTTLSLELDGTGYSASRTIASGTGTLRTANNDTFLDFTADGETVLNTTWTP